MLFVLDFIHLANHCHNNTDWDDPLLGHRTVHKPPVLVVDNTRHPVNGNWTVSFHSALDSRANKTLFYPEALILRLYGKRKGGVPPYSSRWEGEQENGKFKSILNTVLKVTPLALLYQLHV